MISANIIKNTESYVANVKNCVFNNCTTERSSGKRIKHYATYHNVFNKEKQVQVINGDNGRFTSEKVSFVTMDADSSGRKIGCTLLSAPNSSHPDAAEHTAPPASLAVEPDPVTEQENTPKLSAPEVKNLAYGAIYYYLTGSHEKMLSLPLYGSKQLSECLAEELVKLQQFSPMLFSDLRVYFHDLSKESIKTLFKQVVSLLEAQSSVTEAMKSKIKNIEKYIASPDSI